MTFIYNILNNKTFKMFMLYFVKCLLVIFS